MENYQQQFELIGLRDAARLRKMLTQIKQRQQKQQPCDRKVAQLDAELAEAVNRAAKRQLSIPVISYPEGLPISGKSEEIAALIKENQVLILAGETGSGKTTQLPKICLSIGRGIRGLIGHTQPRRIAARTVASRIAEELQVELGAAVGYQVRFGDHTQEDTLVKLMTDGILLAEIQNDPMLLKYDTLIIDEAHERSLNIDFLLGYLKRLLVKRPDLKLIITSATIDLERFSNHFGKAPVMEVSGRTFPVETLYRPWADEFEDVNQAIVESIAEIMRDSKGKGGDILIFMSGERDIREAAKAIKQANFAHLDILPLYARLSLAEQNKVFQNHKGRRVVLSTNVAETSITVPGIRYVIDPGTARISRYSLRTKVQRLPIEPISQASANQRQGRCGRVSEGVCIRLYSEEDFNNRPEFTDAEILRTNLAAVVLQMLHMRIGDVNDFPFVDMPDQRLITDGFKLLEELNAVTKNNQVTTIGRQLGQMPIDPKLARVVLAAKKWGCLREILIIVSGLSIQDPRERPADKQQAADESHRRFWDESSDFLAYVNLWNYLEEQRQELSQSQLRKLCKKEHINFLRVREWRELHLQLKHSLKNLDMKENQEPASSDAVHRAIVTGFLSNIGMKDPEPKTRDYLGTRNRKYTVFPGSSQQKKRHKWIVAADFIETSNLFAHCVAKIDPKWVLESAEHLVKKNYFEPHYDVKSGQVKAYVRISLYGLILVEKQCVAYNKIAPLIANEVFIRSALVEGAYRGKGSFLKRNKKTIDEVHDLEAKSRRRDILVDEEVIYQFYRERVPESISNLAGFEHWRKEAELEDENILHLSREALMLHSASGISEAQFPNELSIDGVNYAVKYCFEPGTKNDGVNIQVPVEFLHVLGVHRLEWLVPGLLRDKCVNLVKGLPKAIRKHFVPVPQFVDKALLSLTASDTPLTEALGEKLSNISHHRVSPEDWDDQCIDDFYRMNIQVLDEDGRVIDQHREIHVLRERYREQVQQTIAKVGDEFEHENVTGWSFGELKEAMELRRGSVTIKAYPALVTEKEKVHVRMLDNPSEAAMENRLGQVRLAMLRCPQICKYLKKQLLKGKDLGLTVVDLGKREQVIDDIIVAATADALFGDGDIVRTEDEFKRYVEAGKADIVVIAERYEKTLSEALTAVVAIKKAIKSKRSAFVLAFAVGDINQHLTQLFYPQFLYRTPLTWFEQYPRYLKAMLHRIEKAAQNPSADKQHSDCLQAFWDRHSARLQKEGVASYENNEEWQKFRWMLEELRVSFFAQNLKTTVPVSQKRLEKQWLES